MPMKVFELAKEIGVGAVDLVDKLKAWEWMLETTWLS